MVWYNVHTLLADCTYQGFVYRDGEDFVNPSRPCVRCHCM